MSRFGCWRVAGLAVAFAFALPGCGGESETKEVEVGYRGPARQNPFLAAERYLAEVGCEVRKVTSFRDLKHTAGTVIATSDSLANFGDTALAMKWVEGGGHLVLLLSGGEQWRSDWAESSSFSSPSHDEEIGDEEKRLFTELGIKSVGQKSDYHSTVRAGSRKYEADLRGSIEFSKPPRRPDVDGGESLKSFSRGYGRITLVADAHPFRNRYLAERDHAALLSELARIDGGRLVWFLNGARISFWKMLWEQGWMALVAVAALVACWLWKNLPRFGPTQEGEDRVARDFAEHLALTGAFLWRHRQVAALLEPLQRDVQTALARRGLRVDEPSVQQELALRSGLSVERVRLALFMVAPESPPVFLRTVQDLHMLRAKI